MKSQSRFIPEVLRIFIKLENHFQTNDSIRYTCNEHKRAPRYTQPASQILRKSSYAF